MLAKKIFFYFRFEICSKFAPTQTALRQDVANDSPVVTWFVIMKCNIVTHIGGEYVENINQTVQFTAPTLLKTCTFSR